MDTYFIYSDESGDYVPKPLLPRSPTSKYFVRSAVIINAVDWRALKEGVDKAKLAYGLKVQDEGKWSHCWSAISAKQTRTAIKAKKGYSYLGPLSEAAITGYLHACMSVIAGVSSLRAFLICSKSGVTRHDSDLIQRWHVQNLMQRSQMDVCSRGEDALGIVFFDPINPAIEKRLRDIYNNLFLAGDFVKYSNLKDSLNFQASHHSVGVQAADFVAGCTIGALKGHRDSIDMFKKYIGPKLRTHPTLGSIKGCGVIGVPRAAIDAELPALGIAK